MRAGVVAKQNGFILDLNELTMELSWTPRDQTKGLEITKGTGNKEVRQLPNWRTRAREARIYGTKRELMRGSWSD